MFIVNVAAADVANGTHPDPGHNSVLIQIGDPCGWFPTPKFSEFKETYKFEFLDTNNEDDEFAFTDEQAVSIAYILNNALFNGYNVIVHCVAGICRSGAVCEVGCIMGFDTIDGYHRIPNVVVKSKLLKAIGYYDY